MRHRTTTASGRGGNARPFGEDGWTKAGVLVAVIGALIALAAWTFPVLSPDVSPSPTAIVTRIPSSSTPDNPSSSTLDVTRPEEGPVSRNPIAVKLSRKAEPGEALVVMVQALGAEWYITRCTADAGAGTSTCGGVRFGDGSDRGGAWRLVALLLTAQQAQELFQDNVFHGDVDTMEVEQRSRIYNYWR